MDGTARGRRREVLLCTKRRRHRNLKLLDSAFRSLWHADLRGIAANSTASCDRTAEEAPYEVRRFGYCRNGGNGGDKYTLVDATGHKRQCSPGARNLYRTPFLTILVRQRSRGTQIHRSLLALRYIPGSSPAHHLQPRSRETEHSRFTPDKRLSESPYQHITEC